MWSRPQWQARLLMGHSLHFSEGTLRRYTGRGTNPQESGVPRPASGPPRCSVEGGPLDTAPRVFLPPWAVFLSKRQLLPT